MEPQRSGVWALGPRGNGIKLYLRRRRRRWGCRGLGLGCRGRGLRRRRWSTVRLRRSVRCGLVLALLGCGPSLRKRDVVVDVIVQRQVALGDGVGAARLVLVDKFVHVAAENVLAVLVHVHLVASLAEDSRAAGRAAADAHAREKLKGRDDRHREAPAADGLAAQPRAEEARESGVNERDDAADARQALDAREAG